MSPTRWTRLMELWGTPPCDDVYASLERAYCEPHRHYHTGRHIEDCLAELDSASSIAESPEEAELALWFHDAVYKPASSNNERKSAQWATAFLRTAGIASERRRRVYDHILATRHAEQALVGDAALVVDVDLSILGREPEAYDAFEQAIREEYKWVPSPIYRSKRAAVLSSFLGRSRIFATDHFFERYEAGARRNLGRAIEALRPGGRGISS